MIQKKNINEDKNGVTHLNSSANVLRLTLVQIEQLTRSLHNLRRSLAVSVSFVSFRDH